MCGADYLLQWEVGPNSGSSPRVRSRRRRLGRSPRPAGIISACAEQTDRSARGLIRSRDHLRVCGADDIVEASDSADKGSSPRVRSRLGKITTPRRPIGIISACAEQTLRCVLQDYPTKDHLRVCGADPDHRTPDYARQGSSPRVRSRHVRVHNGSADGGIISACAEQTSGLRQGSHSRWDHLRVCGADGHGYCRADIKTGSSPRVRSRRPPRMTRHCSVRDHLRVCGADRRISLIIFMMMGSSPRVRSRPPRRLRVVLGHGIISACAEQTPAARNGG